MTSDPSQPRDPDRAAPRSDDWLGEGFGLALRARYPVIGLARRAGEAPADTTRLLLDESLELAPEGTRLRELRYADGRLGMTIDDCGERGLRIVAEEFGAHEISSDGRTITSYPAAGLAPWQWQRLLIGQVLPLAAALRGVEVLHASAVTVGGIAFALAGGSGTGKSQLAAHLALRGAPLLADDVLAVSLDSDIRPRAHAGSTVLSLRREDPQLGAQLIETGGATEIGSDDKQHLLFSMSGSSARLGALYYLRRDGSGADSIGEPRLPTLPELMACSYVKYVRRRSRLTAQLSVQSAIARNCSIVPVNVTSGLDAQTLAAALDAHMTGMASELMRS